MKLQKTAAVAMLVLALTTACGNDPTGDVDTGTGGNDVTTTGGNVETTGGGVYN